MGQVRTPRRALVTGATGFVSGHLVGRLVADGWEVTALVRDTDAPLPCPKVAWPTTGEHAVQVFSELAPDVCFHLATRFQPTHTAADVVALVDGNVTLAALVGEGAAAVADCSVVYTASYWQHFEGASYDPTSLYAAMKQAGADVLRYYAECAQVPVTSLTLFNTYGPGEAENRITSLLIRSAIEQTALDLSPGEQLIDLLHVDDVVEALLECDRTVDPAAAPWRELTVRSHSPVTLRQLAERTGDAVGRDPVIRFGARPYRPREMFSPWATSPDLPGWSPSISLADGLADLTRAIAGARDD